MYNKVLAVEKILGGLRQVSLDQSSFKCSDCGIDTSRFSATVYMLSHESHYGQWQENRIVLMHDGNTDDIELNGFLFSSTVRDSHLFFLTRTSHRHDFTFSIQSPEGEVFEQTFRICNNELLPHIVYAIILFVHVKDKNKTAIFWDMLTTRDRIFNISLGRRLDYTDELNKMAKSIIEEYPFTKHFFQSGLKSMVSILKSEISSLEILK